MGNKPLQHPHQKRRHTYIDSPNLNQESAQPVLPQEILEHIFVNIQDKNDIFNTLITCNAWKSAMCDSKFLWDEWLKRLTGATQTGDLIRIPSLVKTIFRKRFVARTACQSSTLSSIPLSLECTIENLSDIHTLYLFCGHGLKSAKEHNYLAGEAISVISGVGKDFGSPIYGIKDEWPSLWHEVVPSRQTVTFATTIQLVNITVEYYDNQNNLRESKKYLVLHYGRHFWQVVDTKIELCFVCKASFRAPPHTSGGFTIDAIKGAYFANQEWVTRLELEHQTNTVTLDIDATHVGDSPLRMRARYTPQV